MNTLIITEYKTTKLQPKFNNLITSISLPNKPFASGKFGEVYKCTVNDTQQAVKIFTSNGNKSYRTICNLQDAVIVYNQGLKSKGEKPIEEINALYALPLFSFKGRLEGNMVMGYSTNLLDENWENFNVMFSEETSEDIRNYKQKYFYEEGLTAELRLKFILDLLEGFKALQSMKFVYADLNPQNFFINIAKGKLCLIDYDSGGVNEEPETIGKNDDWMAPEIASGEKNTASLYTDYWSIAMAVHYFYNPCSPFFYIKGQSKKLMQQYFANNQYPYIDINNSNFNKEYLKQYLGYKKDLFENVPQKMVEAFKQSFQNGYFKPGARLTSNQWFGLIKPLVPDVYKTPILPKHKTPQANKAVFVTNTYKSVPKTPIVTPLKTKLPNPTINSFTADASVIKKGNSVVLRWNVSNYSKIVLTDGIKNSDVSSQNYYGVNPLQNTKYRIIVTALDKITTIEGDIEIRVKKKTNGWAIFFAILFVVVSISAIYFYSEFNSQSPISISGEKTDTVNDKSTTSIPVKIAYTITVHPNTLSLKICEERNLTYTITPSKSTNQNVTWSSNNSMVAKVSSSGMITAVAPGNAVITASIGDISNICHVSILPADIIENLIFQASQRLLTENDLRGLSKEQLRFLRNGIFAKHGYIFKLKTSDDLRAYFSKKCWYKPQYDESIVARMLNSNENENVKIIQKHEK